MDKCSKCGNIISDNDIMAWKCTECGKALKVNLSKLKKLQMLKGKPENLGKMLLKCSACGKGIDNGNEKIACKCSVCGNIVFGNLEEFVSNNLESKDIEQILGYLNETNGETIVSINLIKCPDCGKQISKRAKSCPNCGCPLDEMVTSGIVRIKMPNNIVDGFVGLFSSRDAIVKDRYGKVLWKGQHGENASFTIDEPTDIIINLGGWANEVSGTVYPKKKYSLIQDMGVHMFATYRITEVDVIDAD